MLTLEAHVSERLFNDARARLLFHRLQVLSHHMSEEKHGIMVSHYIIIRRLWDASCEMRQNGALRPIHTERDNDNYKDDILKIVSSLRE